MLEIKVLLSGLDSLVLALDVVWQSPTLLDSLRTLLDDAKKDGREIPFVLPEGEGQASISFMLQPHGSQGYTWLLLGADYSLKIMDWMFPKSRPSIMVELRSELLWRLGPAESVSRLIAALQHQGGKVLKIKPSRVDACMDVLFPSEHWTPSIADFAVTRAAYFNYYLKHKTFTGVMFGKGVIAARLYDKALEIQTNSNKTWFFDLWQLPKIPDDMNVIRIEFQLRREALKELGMNDITSLFSGLAHLWASCTEAWLKFQDNPGTHHTQRKTLPWWQTVQSSFMGICEGEPLIRAAAIENDKRRLRQQATGLCSSLIALDRDSRSLDAPQPVDIEDYSKAMTEAVERLGKTQEELQEDIARKHAKRARLHEKYESAVKQRNRLGLLIPDRKGLS